MAMKLSRQMPSFEGVAAGATATLRLPVGLSYEQLLISYAGATLAQLTDIRLVANGKTMMRFAGGSRLDVLNKFDGRGAAAGVLTLDFTRYGLRTRQAEELTVLGTGIAPSQDFPVSLSTLALEIDIAAAAVGPVLSARAMQSAPRPLGLVKQVREYTYNAPAAGEYEISDIPKGPLFNRVFFHSANITALRVERDNYTVFERTKAENDLVQADGVRVPQAGVFVFDPTETGLGAESLETLGVHDLRFVLTMSAAGAVPVTVEALAPLGV